MEAVNIGQATALTSPDPLMLVSTAKEDGTLNMAPVSFFMYASFNPAMLAFGMGKQSNTGENIRRTGKAVLAAPGLSLADAVMAYGRSTGNKVDKLSECAIELQDVEGTDLKAPADARIVFSVSLDQTVDAGDHYLYVCTIDGMWGDGSREALLAWDGYAHVAPATRG